MIAEETRLFVDEQGVTRRIRAGKVVPAAWEAAYEAGESVEEPEKAQTGPERDKAQKEPDTTKSDDKPSLSGLASATAASRRRKQG